MPESFCIFCGKPGDQIRLTREHVLPAHLCGHWTLDHLVCENCNAILGQTVDHQADPILDVLAAAHALGLKELEHNLLKHAVGAEVRLCDGAVLRANSDGKSFNIPPQDTSMGWRFYPGADLAFVDPLRKNLSRRAQARHVPREVAEKEIERITVGVSTFEAVQSQMLETCLTKREETLHGSLQPKREAHLERLVAKIAYEILFLIGGEAFFRTENLRRTLVRLINGEMPPGVVTYRKKALVQDARNFHRITVLSLASDGFPYVELSLFGCIDFLLLINIPLASEFWDSFDSHFGLSDRVGLDYWQGINEPWIEFRAIHANRKATPLVVKGNAV